MDFKLVLEKLITAFERENVRYALMGGFALGAWGVPRGTVDIDFLVLRDDMGKVRRIMDEAGYECYYGTENVSQFSSPLRIFGEVDFLHAFREASLKMLEKAAEKEVLNGSLKIRVLRVEDLIAFKLQGMVNDEARRAIDLRDMEDLLKLHGATVDWDLMREYFDLFDHGRLFDELRNRYAETE